MKTALVLLVLALAFGIVRHGRLAAVNREVSQLEVRLNGHSSESPVRRVGRTRTARPAAGPSSELPAELEDKVRRCFGFEGNTEEKEASWKPLLKDFARLDHRAVAALIGSVAKDQPRPWSAHGGISGFCIDLLARANPEEGLLLLGGLEGLDDRGWVAANAFGRWGIDRPNEALAWYDDLAVSGDSLAKEPLLLERVLQVEARIDPAGALARLVSPDLPVRPEEIPYAGAGIAMGLRDSREHLAFFEALRRAEESGPAPPVLAGLRVSYTKQLGTRLHSWPFDEAEVLIQVGFRPDEEQQMISQIARSLELAEPERWADWISTVETPANTRHPITSLIYNWARSDPESAGAWLAGMPPGNLKEKAVESYVSSVSAEDPELALPRALSLREGRRRTGLLKLIHSTWRKRDPAAAAAFAQEHGL